MFCVILAVFASLSCADIPPRSPYYSRRDPNQPAWGDRDVDWTEPRGKRTGRRGQPRSWSPASSASSVDFFHGRRVGSGDFDVEEEEGGSVAPSLLGMLSMLGVFLQSICLYVGVGSKAKREEPAPQQG